MTLSSFKKLHSMILKPSSNRRGKWQFSSKYQLFVLHFLGTEGNGMSNQRVRGKLPNRKGTCKKMEQIDYAAIID